ncbi:alkaline phosphatase family protein [Oerskovia sp. M15]
MTVLPEVLPDGLLAPRYDGLALSSVLPAAAGALGVDLVTATGTSSSQARADLALPAADRVCVVLVDGLGHANLTERAGHAPFLRSILGSGRVLTSSFPSTTAAAIGTFGTGTSPGRTGMLGYTQRNAATGRLANMVSWEGRPAAGAPAGAAGPRAGRRHGPRGLLGGARALRCLGHDRGGPARGTLPGRRVDRGPHRHGRLRAHGSRPGLPVLG